MKSLRVYEQSFYPLGKELKELHWNALAKLNELHGDRYFTLRYNGIRFNQFVGVIQVNDLTIEILPKLDNLLGRDWQQVLMEMLRATKKLKMQNVGHANVSKQSIHLLDIYFDWFLLEVQLLIRQGLIKRYYKETSNVKALKGKLEFASHINKNLVHKERFYTTHQVYGHDHTIHRILGQALDIVTHFSKGTYRFAECKNTQVDFPEVSRENANAATFDRLPKDRKIAPYKTALELARLVILNYSPDVKGGKEHMLALLFDMNLLWEEYVLIMLQNAARKHLIDVQAQRFKYFWGSNYNKPDIVLVKDGRTVMVIDTKWKNLSSSIPSSQDLRQMYVYNEYWNSKYSVLLYPSNRDIPPAFKNFNSLLDENSKPVLKHHCAVLGIDIFNDNNELENKLGERLFELIGKECGLE